MRTTRQIVQTDPRVRRSFVEVHSQEGRVSGDIIIRRLNAGEAQQYIDFRAEALKQTPTAFTSTSAEEKARPVTWAVDRIVNADHRDDFVLGAFASEVLVGIAGFGRPEQKQARHKGTLFGMAVAPDVAGRGVGRQLVEALLGEARKIQGVTQVVLTVSEGNSVAERLYRSCGFREFGREPRAVIVDGVAIIKIHMVCMLDGY